MVIISAENLSMRFGLRGVFKDISFRLNFPSSLAVTGPNGSGKSTLLKIIAGLLTPTSGKIRMESDSNEVKGEEQKKLMAMVSPEMNFYDELTGAENLEFFMKASGFRMTSEEIEGALNNVGLRGRGDDYLKGYSSGMRMRLKYALAILKKPEIMLVDEPSTNLDIQGRNVVYDLMRMHQQNGILIFATNEDDEISIANKRIDLAG
ncbi:MAG: ABC transporter ATP-binding protein [candidate division Zixibacteria bacterium]|nr:ABC transporter ATP-binding protein [candidate division Zixibacteria bacterium]NIS18084.1 ABC transporter ATP-binding protein [candidate division Zixibacteria bacterium]NIS48030.1 ABC transporter ATP-binding protein [candidate division Zixibacteria bacterium]NIT54364.1 ABC transporter ATP-binding protein [candidate division Zixibacteria bacterium]NIU16145.1 ABC transporter ATP-binding protein [candidate division Zixibacteria bacterium]